MNPEEIEETLTDMMMWSEHKWRDADVADEPGNRFTQTYAQCVTALSLHRIATSLQSPGVHPDVVTALNRIATGTEMLERQ